RFARNKVRLSAGTDLDGRSFQARRRRSDDGFARIIRAKLDRSLTITNRNVRIRGKSDAWSGREFNRPGLNRERHWRRVVDGAAILVDDRNNQLRVVGAIY